MRGGRRAVAVAAVAVLGFEAGRPAAGLMYDVIEAGKLPPAECGTAGCLRWDAANLSHTNYWRDPANIAAAGSACAQPGNAVHGHPYGAWCVCAGDGGGATASAAAGVDPVFNLESSQTDKERGMWLSFSGTDVVLYPASSTDGRGVWRFVPTGSGGGTAVGDTVFIVNEWHAPSEPRAGMYLSFHHHGPGLVLSASDYNGWVPWKVVDSGSGDGTVFLQNRWPADDTRFGMYAGYADGNTSMVLVAEADVASRAVWTLVKAAAIAQASGYCVSPKGVPEQINLQVASSNTVVASWVTFETEDPSKPPTVVLTAKTARQIDDRPRAVDGRLGGGGTGARTVHGFTHKYATTAGRVFYMHFVALRDLVPRGQFSYRVRSGGAGAAWSASFSFRALPDTTTPTRLDMYGDLGVYEWNSMENLRADCNADPATSVADAIVHMGDHAYNEGDNDEIRADAYMNAFQPILSECPWFPVVGNHEYSGMQLARYLNSTWEQWAPLPLDGTGPALDPADAKLFHSTATSALGFFLSTGNLHAAGTAGRIATTDGSPGPTAADTSKLTPASAHAYGAPASARPKSDDAHPSNTSRYFSADVGLVHLIGLDFNMYYGVDACVDRCKAAQLAWFEEDLRIASANRKNVPWIIAMSHYPLFCTGCAGNSVDSSAYYASDDAERFGNANASAAAAFEAQIRRATNGTAKARTPPTAANPAGQKENRGASDSLVADIAPLLQKYGVDIFMAGHWHYYESLWPGTQGSEGCPACLEPIQKDFTNPRGTVHITTGNGGPPGLDSFREHCPGQDCERIPATRRQSQAYGYGRLVAHNASTLAWTQFNNSDGAVVDTFVIQQRHHGPF